MNRKIFRWIIIRIQQNIHLKEYINTFYLPISNMKEEQSNQNQPCFEQYEYSNKIFTHQRPSNQDSSLSMKNSYSFASKKEKNKKQVKDNHIQKSEMVDQQLSKSKVQSTNNTSKNSKNISLASNRAHYQKPKYKTKLQCQQNAIDTLQRIKKWRAQNQAPVDVVGCEVLYDSNEPLQIQKYQILVALMLSVQTKDQTTGKIMERLKKYGLKPKIMSQISEQKLLQLIRQTNFNRRKTKNIIEVSKQICRNGLPKNKQQLMQYPGVGVKIATLYMRTAQGVNDGIGVDTHVHRISNRLGWVNNTKNPIQTEQQLQRVFPKQYWNEINIALVGFGQTLCQAKKPKCGECPVRSVCPSSLFKQYF